jgi:carboxymethylenebutenolidase
MKAALQALAITFVFALCSISLAAQTAAAPAAGTEATKTVTVSTKSQDVTYPSGKDTVSGYLVQPEKQGTYGAVIVVHEWWGMNDWVKEQTQKLAALGYVALAVDLYNGKSATDPSEAHELSRGLAQDRAVRDIQAAYDYLGAQKNVNKDRIAIIGWCMGGGYAADFAVKQPHLAGVVINYGALPSDPNDVQQIGAPVLGNFGADDKGITPTDVNQFQDYLKKLGHYVDVKIYPGAGHAFENPNNTNGYRPQAAADAWARTVAFLHHCLG